MNNDKMPEDKDLSALYRHAGRDEPPAHLDEAVLAAARREADNQSHPAYSPFSSNWRVPVSLAAVLVLSVSIVFLVEDAVPPAVDETDIMLSQVDSNVPPSPRAEPLERRKLEKPQLPAASSAPLKKAREDAGQQAAQPEEEPARLAASESETADIEEGIVGGAVGTATLASKPAVADAGEARILPSMDEIKALRAAGKIKEASHAVDLYIRHHFGEDLDEVDTRTVNIPTRDWFDLVVELRQLDRLEESKKIEKLFYDGRRSGAR